MAKKAAATESEPTFEEALEKLETLVRAMETEKMPLDEAISSYEESTRLYQLCQKRLEEAQGRIELIRKKASGETETVAFEADSPQTGNDKDQSARSDGELF